MGVLRGHGAELAFGASAFLFAAGIAGDVAAERVGVNEAQVDQLQDRHAQVVDSLTTNYPVLENLHAEGQISARDARELGADRQWFVQHNQQRELQAAIDEAKEGHGVLNTAGKLGWGLGVFSIWGSGVVLYQTASQRIYENERGIRSLRNELKQDYDLEGKVFGLSRSDLPVLHPSGMSVAVFSAERPLDGLTFFAKHTTNQEKAEEVFQIVKDAEAGDPYDVKLVEFLAPLFGAEITKARGGFDATNLGSRLAAFTARLAELNELGSRASRIPNIDELDPNNERHMVPRANRLLDIILPLDQDDLKNPSCASDFEDPNDTRAGRHWADYIDMRGRKIEEFLVESSSE